MPDINNILADIPAELATELFNSLLLNEQVHIERIVSRGHCNSKNEWYDQAHDEWVILLQGAATLVFFGQSAQQTLQAGDYVLIPAHCKHRVDWTHPEMDSIWLAVHVLASSDKPPAK